MADLSQAAFTHYDNIVLHHVPNALAPGLLSAMLVYAFCLGALVLDLSTNLFYDFSLFTRTGWREPVKATNRIAYFVARYGAFVFLTMTIIYMNLPGSNCRAYAKAINVMWVLPLISVDLIFVQRTLAVYGWKQSLAIVLGTIYVAYVGLCMYSVIEFGYGYQIPTTNFCAYQVLPTRVHPHGIIFIVYITLTIALDTLILLLTTHRLVEGGLGNVPHLLITKSAELRRDKAARRAAGHEVGEVSLSGLLLRQGVGYFLILEGSRLAFLIVYYLLDSQTSYQVLVSGILCTVGPLMAGMLFRQTSEAVKRAAYTSRSGGAEHGQTYSHGRSCRSSIAATPSVMPLSPRSPNGDHMTMANIMPPTPLSNKPSAGSDNGGTMEERFYNERNSSGGDSINTGHLHAPHDGMHTAEEDMALRIFVEQQTDIEMSSSFPAQQRQQQQQQQQQQQAHLPSLSSVHRHHPEEDEGLPIHQRFARSTARNDSVDEHSYFAGNTAFTPVLPSTRGSFAQHHHHQDGYGTAR